MADKALVALWGANQDATTVARESSDAIALGCTVEYVLPHGILITGTLGNFDDLALRGYWVRVCRHTDVLRIGNYDIRITAPPPAVPAELEIPAALAPTWMHHLVQLAGPPIEAWASAIVAAGVKIITRISDYAFFVYSTPDRILLIQGLPFVTWTGPLKPAYRLAPTLNGISGAVQHLVVSTFPSGAVTGVGHFIEQLGGTVIASRVVGEFGRIIAAVDSTHLAEIASQPQVFFLDYLTPDTRPIDELSCQVVSTGVTAAAYYAGYDPKTTYELDGNNVTIAISDTGVEPHPDFGARLVSQESFDPASNKRVDALGHGTAVAGIAAGNANTGGTVERDAHGFSLGQGVAPGAAIVSIKVTKDIAVAPGFPEYLPIDVHLFSDAALRHNSHIMNNSWESGASAVYGDICRAMDDVVQRQRLVMVCGSGNGVTPITAPGFAKNVITVGGSWSPRIPTTTQSNAPLSGGPPGSVDQMWPFSRPGLPAPARIVPTVVAPASYMASALAKCGEPFVEPPPPLSTLPAPLAATAHALGGHLVVVGTTNCAVGFFGGVSGTSYSAPHVAGACALLIQSWQNRTGGLVPSPALLKAWIINGAVNPGAAAVNPGPHIPSTLAGWGRLSLPTTLESSGGQRLFVDQLYTFQAASDTFLRRIAPIDTTQPLKITLVWSERPLETDTTDALRHNLDLEVEEIATGQRYLGNVNFVNGFSQPATLSDPADKVNNVECVYIQNPQGLYNVRIHPSLSTLTFDSQDFALVIENAEQISPSPASIVTLIDRSGSMVGSGYVEPAKTAAKAFIACTGVGDELAVLSFSDTSVIEMPFTPVNESVRQTAASAVDNIAFSGCTFMGDAIQKAKQLLVPATNPNPAILLLSDGYDNQGCQAGGVTAIAATAAAPAVPIYTCALGPASDQVLLEGLASSSGGRYFFAPDEFDLQEIYGYIAAATGGDDVIELDTVFASKRTLSVPVDDSVTRVTFQISWDNPSLTRVTRVPTATEIEITLFDPRGIRWNTKSCHTRVSSQPGSLTLHIEQPPSGIWKVFIRTSLKKHTRCCVGVFARSASALHLTAGGSKVQAGSSIDLRASGFIALQPKGWKTTVKASIRRPPASIEAIAQKYKKQLGRTRVTHALKTDGVSTQIAKLIVLDRARRKSGRASIFKRVISTMSLRSKGATFNGIRHSTTTPGTYNFVATARMKGPKGSTPIVRKQLASVLVVP